MIEDRGARPVGHITHRRLNARSRRDRHAQLRSMLLRSDDARSGAPRVVLAGKLTGMAAPGGGESQLTALARHLPRVGVRARLWRPWEDGLVDADCLHLVGSEPEHLPVVQAAREAGLRVVISTVAWFDLASYARQSTHWLGRMAACGRFLIRAAAPRMPSWRRRLYRAADLLLPNSRAEADQLVRYFGISPRNIEVIRNGADERFAHVRPDAFVERFGLRDFVLYPGRIEPRKNQLGFLRAMRGAGVPIVVLGDVVPGHEAYLAACRAEADAQVHFVRRLDPSGELLGSAYAACRCVVLTSWFETPGLTALEAGMSGVPLVLPRRGAAPEYFGALARYVASHDARDIRLQVLDACALPRSAALAQQVRRNFTWTASAQATRDAYAKIL